MPPDIDAVRVRTLFISDVHLGMKACQAGLLLDFLRHHHAETIFLVGDIVDRWPMKPGNTWPLLHLRVVSELLRKARNGSRIVYVPGNHDEFFREFVGLRLAGVEIVERAIHDGVDGRRYLVTHGDQFDLVVQHARWLAFLGHWAYRGILAVNAWFNKARRSLGLDYWSLSAWAKGKVKMIVRFVSDFEENLSAEARRCDAQGVICGHIHHAADHDLFGVRYINLGDWVESCTGVCEHHDGRFEIVRLAAATHASRARSGSSSARPRGGGGIGAQPREADDASRAA